MTVIAGFQAPLNHINELETYVRELYKVGFRWIEVIAPKLDNPALIDQLKYIKEKYHLQMSVHAQFMDVNLSACHPEIRDASIEVIQKNIHFASAIKAQLLLVHGGFINWADFLPESHPLYSIVQNTFTKLKQEHISNLIFSLKRLISMAKTVQVNLAVENLGCLWEIPVKIQDFNQIMENFDEKELGIVLDFAHANIADMSIYQFMNVFEQRISHLHINQNDGKYDLHQPLRSIPADWIFALRKLHANQSQLGLIFEMNEQPLSEIIRSKEILMGKLNT